MLNLHALIHHHVQASSLTNRGSLLTPGAQLHPHGLRAQIHSLLNHARQVLVTAENLHQIRDLRQVLQRRVHRLTQHKLALRRQNRVHKIQLVRRRRLQIRRHKVGGTRNLIAHTHNRNRAGITQNVQTLRGGRTHPGTLLSHYFSS